MCSIRVDNVDERNRRITSAGVVEKTVGFPARHPVATWLSGLRIGNLIDIDFMQLNLFDSGADGHSQLHGQGQHQCDRQRQARQRRRGLRGRTPPA